MLNNEYKFNMDLDLAQFVIAIVLDSYGNKSAALKVKSFYNIKVKNSDEQNEIIRRRRDKLYLDILYNSKKMGKSFLETTINMFYYDKVLSGDRDRTNSSSRKVSLLDLNINLSEKELYQKSMLLLLSSDNILIHYMRTSMFFTQFKKWLNYHYRYDKFGRLNGLTDSKCRELLTFVISRTNDYFISNYDGAVSTPDNYIFQSLNSFFKDTAKTSGEFDENSDVSKFYASLNSRGQDREIDFGDDSSATALSTVGVDAEVEKESIDFRDIAIKICKASIILYTYKNSDIAFYDLFSRYRDISFKDTDNQDLAKRCLVGCNVVGYSAEDSFTLNLSDISSLKDRTKQREAYLTSFNSILISEGISLKEIKNIYDQQIKVTKNMPKRDKRRLYSIEGSDLKGNFTTNAQRFKDLFDGFTALRDFIKFIYSKDNTLGITINNFNTEVFRNMKIAETVHDLKSYLAFGDITKKLISQVATSYDGVNLKTNNEVNEYLEEMKRKQMFNLLKNTPLKDIGNINFSSNPDLDKKAQSDLLAKHGLSNRQALTIIKNFTKKVKDFLVTSTFSGGMQAHSVQQAVSPSSFVIDVILENKCDDNYREHFEKSILQMIALYKRVNGVLDFHNSAQFKIISSYLTAVECLMALDGVPMLNSYGFFDYDDVNVCIDYLATVEENYLTTFSNKSTWFWDYKTRKMLINAIFDLFFGNFGGMSEPENGEPGIEYWQKCCMLFSLNNFSVLYMRDLSLIADHLKYYNSDQLQTYLNLCGFDELLSINSEQVSLSRLYKLYNEKLLLYKTGDSIDLLTAKRNRELFNAVLNGFYATVFSEKDNTEYSKFLNILKEGICEVLQPKGSVKTSKVKTFANLSKMANDLYSMYPTHISHAGDTFFCKDRKLLNRFQSLAEFDDNGFAMCKGNLFITQGGSVLHALGAVVKLKYSFDMSIRELTRIELLEYEAAKEA